MAYSVIETKVVNPARKRKSNVAKTRRKLSAKQIRAGFGGKRRKINAACHRPRTKKNSAPRRKTTARGNAPRRTTHRKRNPTPEIISLVMGNPSRKKGRNMAKSKKPKNPSGHRHRNAAGTARRRNITKIYNRARRRRNPAGIGRPMDWLKGGVGVLGGVLVTRALPQAVAPTYNTSWTGYAMNAVTAVAAAWGTHAVTKDPVLTASVAAGGFASLIARMISDMSSFGQYLTLTGYNVGVGDYQFSNFVSPQRITNQRQAMVQVPQGWNGTALPTGGYMDRRSMGADAIAGDW